MEMRKYTSELRQFPDTYSRALAADINSLKNAIAGASASSILAVGSGGSYTTAALLCELHELYTGKVSRAATPLEIICNPSLSESSPLVLISAEGKNPDAFEVLHRAKRHSARSIHLLTNTNDSPLARELPNFPDVFPHVHPTPKKDGYLATNSLLLNATLVARTYAELDGQQGVLPPDLSHLKVNDDSIGNWTQRADAFVRALNPSRALIVTYAPNLRPIAVDLESKLAEGALFHCQLADLRSFAHGRHLWLSARPEDVAIISIIDDTLEKLWKATLRTLPTGIPNLVLKVPRPTPLGLVTGIIAQMHLIDRFADAAGTDPGRPDVPSFGRELYYADLGSLIEPPTIDLQGPERSKFSALGGRWPLKQKGEIHREREEFTAILEATKFRGIVFDYDGTLCTSQARDRPPDNRILEHLQRLTSAGICVGIATGRGGSVQESLREAFDEDTLSKIYLGLYNCGYIGDAASTTTLPGEASEHLSHALRLLRRLEATGAPIAEIRESMPYQISVRLKPGVVPDEMWWVISDALRLSGLKVSSVVKSRHSIDILSSSTSKSHLVAFLVQSKRIDPYQILTVGDQGAWPGNDHSLLDHKLSLSVDQPSRRLDRGWKLAPSHLRDVDATLWYLERTRVSERGEFSLTFE